MYIPACKDPESANRIKATDSAPCPGEGYATAIFLGLLFLLTIGSAPFQEGSGLSIDKSGAGQFGRQVLLLLLMTAAIPVLFMRRAAILRLIACNWSVLVLYGWAGISVFWSGFFEVAVHRLSGTILCGILTLVGATLSARSLIWALVVFTGGIMMINYGGVVLIPSLALDHDGLWKGLHLQKNIAGYFSAVSSLLWLFLGWRRRNCLLILGGLVWLVFLWYTHSRTSLGMYFVALGFCYMLNIGLERQFKSSVFYFCVAVIFLVLPLWFFFFYTTIFDFSGFSILGGIDLTFTGRTEIWDFVRKSASLAPVIGVGYGSFWAVGDRSPALLLANDFVAQYTEAHNGYLDVLVTLGGIGLSILVFVLLKPIHMLANYKSLQATVEQNDALILCALLLCFGILHNFLESTVFQGLSPVWTLMLFSLLVIKSKLRER